MYKVEQSTLIKALKPFDIVSIENGCVGYIKEVGVNSSQISFENQIRYAITWLTGDEDKEAWFDHDELTYHSNLFIKIAEDMCNPHGRNDRSVQLLFNNMER